MKDAIVEKLSYELGQAFQSERQIVYNLVEVRKLLEKEGTLSHECYRSLKLSCDWVVHPKLSWKSANDIASYFDSYEAEYRASGVTIKEFNFAPLFDFLTHKRFRAELIAACAANGVRTQSLEADSSWREFLFYYMAVIQDCPLHASADDAKHITSVSAGAWPISVSEQIFPGQLVIEWTWTMKDGSHPKSVTSLF